MTALIPVGQEWNDIKNMAGVLVSSGFLPKAVDTPQKAATIMLMSRELGIGPMEGFSKISVIQGKPTIGAELMKAMVHVKLPTAIFRLKHSDDKACTFEAARPGDEPQEFTYTMKEAEAMGLHSKDNWKKQPKTMLRWRCISAVCRTVFPDCVSGVSHTPEEMGAEVNADGEVITIPLNRLPAVSCRQYRQKMNLKKARREATLKLIRSKIKSMKDVGYRDKELCEKLKVKSLEPDALAKESTEKTRGIIDELINMENV